MSAASAEPADTAAAWERFLASPERHTPRSGYPYQHCFAAAARRHQLPEALLLAVGRGESALDPLARSHADAYGLMQIRWPLTAQHLGIFTRRGLLDPCRNVDAGSRYLKELLARFGDLHVALAAYNVGPTRVADAGENGIPQAGERYSRYIYRQLRRDAPVPSGMLARSTADDLAPRPSSGAREQRTGSDAAGDHALVVFHSPVRAKSLTAALARRFPDLDVQTRTTGTRSHVVTVTTTGPQEYESARRALRQAGFDLPLL